MDVSSGSTIQAFRLHVTISLSVIHHRLLEATHIHMGETRKAYRNF
jgi:hypothetical protein